MSNVRETFATSRASLLVSCIGAALMVGVIGCAIDEGDALGHRRLEDADEDGEPGAGAGPTSLGCNPLANDCPEGTGCHDLGGDPRFVCVALDPEEPPAGALDPCRFGTDCQVGLACTLYVPDESCRAGGFGCCSPLCDLDDAASGCPASTVCVPYFDEPPPGAENLGLCAL